MGLESNKRVVTGAGKGEVLSPFKYAFFLQSYDSLILIAV